MVETVTIGDRPVETVGVETRPVETVSNGDRAIEQLRVDPDVVYKSSDGLSDGGLGASLFGH